MASDDDLAHHLRELVSSGPRHTEHARNEPQPDTWVRLGTDDAGSLPAKP